MSRTFYFSCMVAFVAGLAFSAEAGNWPSWRGDVAGSGIVRGEKIPLVWGTKKNVRWRVPLPDRGNSSPIVWGEKVFITQATDSDNRRTVMCFDKRTGELLWRTGVTYTKAEKTHKTNPYCSGSPATDGRVVVANYASAGVAAYDLEGQQLWHRKLGPQDHIWGNGTSPVLFGDLCIIYHGPGPGSSLYALDKLSGRTIWKRRVQEKDDPDRVDGFRGANGGINGAFTTPIIIEVQGRHELILSEANTLRALSPEDGSELWYCNGLNPLIYTSPVYDGKLVLSMGGLLWGFDCGEAWRQWRCHSQAVVARSTLKEEPLGHACRLRGFRLLRKHVRFHGVHRHEEWQGGLRGAFDFDKKQCNHLGFAYSCG